jgi:hypothetical protein
MRSISMVLMFLDAFYKLLLKKLARSGAAARRAGETIFAVQCMRGSDYIWKFHDIYLVHTTMSQNLSSLVHKAVDAAYPRKNNACLCGPAFLRLIYSTQSN